MLRARWKPYTLDFTFEARTSRSVMHHKDTFFVEVWDDVAPAVRGLGECALFRGLSREDSADYEAHLDEACREPMAALEGPYSSIRFGFEGAMASLARAKGCAPEPTAWERGEKGIPINGLVWMGDRALMLERIKEKIAAGFRCIKLKIGGIDFGEELELLRFIRNSFAADELELRLDANGAFTADNVMQRLEALSAYSVHSLEQPVRAGQYDLMARVCRESPISIALDEELIGTTSADFKAQLLEHIRPAYVILKPSLCGGFSGADEWIAAAQARGIGWWATSALESNIGLEEIAHWVSRKDTHMPQGLGTGQLYSNNVGSGIRRIGSEVWAVPDAPWPNVF